LEAGRTEQKTNLVHVFAKRDWNMNMNPCRGEQDPQEGGEGALRRNRYRNWRTTSAKLISEQMNDVRPLFVGKRNLLLLRIDLIKSVSLESSVELDGEKT
jgi:hypothetical protein